MSKRMTVGIVGCGNISGTYLKGCGRMEDLEVVACADLAPERAQAKAAEFNLRACTVKELLADPAVDIVLNLTVPSAHAAVALAALKAGKHVYDEKPLATSRRDGARVLALAAKKKLRVGCAPDTFFSAGAQLSRKLIDEGRIGTPVAATVFMMGRGPEGWHPDPEFFYQPGAGPLFDMGPYYLTALVNLLGPVRRVSGSARISFRERVIGSEPKRGQKIKVRTPTHIAGVLDFVSGAVATLVMSFDVWAHHLPCIEIHGSEGSLQVHDPNNFQGEILLWEPGVKSWAPVEPVHGYRDPSRGVGLADMAHAIRTGRRHRASGQMAGHVLDIMQSIGEASKAGRYVTLSSTCRQPAALPVGLPDGHLDD